MATYSRRESSGETDSEIPEVLDADEHGTLQLAFRDERVSDCDAFEMPE